MASRKSYHPIGEPFITGPFKLQMEKRSPNSNRRWRLSRNGAEMAVFDESQIFDLEELLEEVVDHIADEGDDL